jgi:uncharacterized protein (DUF58 family)
VSPTPRAAVLLAACALLALALGPLVAAVLAVALAVAVALDAHAVAAPPTVRERLPAALARGVPVELMIEVQAGPQRRARVRQPHPPELELSASTGLDCLAATMTPRTRGRHRLAPAAVRLEGPLGLASRDHAIGVERELLVYPDLPAARRLARAARSGVFGDPRRRRGPLGVGTEFELVRDHVHGDDVRQLNWLATARMQRPMTNQFRVETERDVICLLDCGRLMAAPLAGRTRLDAALDAMAAVALTAEEFGDRAGAIAFDDRVRLTIAPAHRSASTVVRALFDLEARAVESDYEQAFALVGAHKRSIVLVFTDLLDDRAARAMTAAATLLARRHAVIVVSAGDPEIDALPDREPREPLEVYETAVALDVLAARARAVAALSRRCQTVVGASPQTLSAACVRAYLAVKWQGPA